MLNPRQIPALAPWQDVRFGSKQTYAVQNAMSALPPKADMCSALADVCFGPIADIAAHSMTSSARDISDCGTLMPSAFAVF